MAQSGARTTLRVRGKHRLAYLTWANQPTAAPIKVMTAITKAAGNQPCASTRIPKRGGPVVAPMFKPSITTASAIGTNRRSGMTSAAAANIAAGTAPTKTPSGRRRSGRNARLTKNSTGHIPATSSVAPVYTNLRDRNRSEIAPETRDPAISATRRTLAVDDAAAIPCSRPSARYVGRSAKIDHGPMLPSRKANPSNHMLRIESAWRGSRSSPPRVGG